MTLMTFWRIQRKLNLIKIENLFLNGLGRKARTQGCRYVQGRNHAAQLLRSGLRGTFFFHDLKLSQLFKHFCFLCGFERDIRILIIAERFNNIYFQLF